ncbi:hypothetical protein BaRGS_00014704 [Batillaria attramentaria]|uniref:Uncharacterized protein n=1 Tax=Batillaria attramentaria TaxID=370345 RepID=A0ABD0L476_9CAEN
MPPDLNPQRACLGHVSWTESPCTPAAIPRTVPTCASATEGVGGTISQAESILAEMAALMQEATDVGAIEGLRNPTSFGTELALTASRQHSRYMQNFCEVEDAELL